MNERTTDNREQERSKEVQATGEASDNKRVGAKRKRRRDCGEVSDTPTYPVSVEEGPGAWSRDILERQEAEEGSSTEGPGGGEPKAQGGFDLADTGTDTFKKKRGTWFKSSVNEEPVPRHTTPPYYRGGIGTSKVWLPYFRDRAMRLTLGTTICRLLS